MEISSEPLESRQVQLTITVPPDRIERAMREVAQAYARHQRVPGYRPGKVPLDRVTAIVGEEVVRKAAIEQLSTQVTREAIKQENLHPVVPASVEVVAEDPLTLRAVVALEPEVQLGDYHALRVPAPDVPEPAEEDVETLIERWRQDLGVLTVVDRPSETGDTMSLALVGRLGDKIVVDDTALTLVLRPEGATAAQLPPDVADELVGLAAGASHAFAVKYSEVWTVPELQGQEVAFEATVDSVAAFIAPPLDDALAVRLAGVDDLDTLRKHVRGQMVVRAFLEARDAHAGAAIDALVGIAEVAFPQVILDHEVAQVVADLRGRVERQGFTWEKWLELQGKDEEGLWAEIQPEAEQRLRRRLVMTEFVRLEGIEVKAGEIADELRRFTSSLSPSARRNLPAADEMRRSTGNRMLANRATARLLEIVAPDEPAADAASVPDAPVAPAVDVPDATDAPGGPDAG